ncbi:hypothetical protein ACH427_16905 [Streptomyces sp. NPDC020379]|uniref:hypothetical protein n=1 Tax=Streptomyces sp. NPDC020379 TaxID=3365071 RepID=UPI0037B097A8
MSDDHPLRAVLALLALGLAGPTAALHQQIGGLLDGPADRPAPVVTAPDTGTDDG